MRPEEGEPCMEDRLRTYWMILQPLTHNEGVQIVKIRRELEWLCDK